MPRPWAPAALRAHSLGPGAIALTFIAAFVAGIVVKFTNPTAQIRYGRGRRRGVQPPPLLAAPGPAAGEEDTVPGSALGHAFL